MSKQDHIAEGGTFSTIDPIFDNLEHELMEKSIEMINTDLKKVNRSHQLKLHRRTFRKLMELLKNTLHQIEMDEHIYSLGNDQKFGNRVKESDIRILRKANLAMSELLKLNEKLKKQQRRLKGELERRGKNNIS